MGFFAQDFKGAVGATILQKQPVRAARGAI
jgi:hypothetical protein